LLSWFNTQDPDEVYVICETNWNNGLLYSASIGGYYWDFGNGYVPFFAVVGAYNQLFYGENSLAGATATVPAAIESFNNIGVTGPIPNQVMFFGDILTFDTSEIFTSPNGDVTVTIDDNSNPNIASAVIEDDILTITALNTMGQTMITLLGDDGVMTGTDEFYVTVLNPNPNTETLEFAIEDSPTQQNYPNNPNPYENTWTDFGWTSITIEEEAAIISMSITGNLFSDNYPSEGSLWITSPEGTTVMIADGFASGTNAVDLEIADFVTQPCMGEWILFFEDSFGDGGHALYNGSLIIDIEGSASSAQAPSNLDYTVTDDDVHLTWDYSTGGGGDPVILAWDDGINNDGIGLTNGGNFSVASRWTPTELVNYHNMPITMISFYARGVNTSYTLKVWTGENAANEVLSQPLTGLVMEAWNDIVLDDPIIINATSELWFGYSCNNQPAEEYPAGCDAGTAVAGFGDMISLGTGWDPLSGYGLDFNWNLQATANGRVMQRHNTPEIIEVAQVTNEFLSLGNLGSTPLRDRLLLGFKVYRDAAEIAYLEDTNARQYDDLDLADGVYQYFVTAVYDTTESNASNTIEVTINNSLILDPPVGLEIFDNGHLTWYPPGTGGDLLYEGFETWPPAGWLFLDEDNDGYTWDDGGALGLGAYEGDGLAYSASYLNPPGPGALLPDNWLISPAVNISLDAMITYYVCAQDNAWAAEHYGVYISTTGTDPADFELLFQETLTARNYENKILPKGSRDQGNWYERNVSTAGFTGTCYIAFRHFSCSDMFYVDLDEITVSEGVMRPLESYNIYLNGDLVANTTDLSYLLQDLVEGDTYNVGVTALYTEGESVPIEGSFTYVPGSNDEGITAITSLTGNYPNPFNPESTIAFTLAEDAPVEITIYNVKGQKVRTLINEVLTYGNHSVVWNGTDDRGNIVSSGIYYYKMDSGKFTSSKKMVLMK
jgi:hypothetical protein